MPHPEKSDWMFALSHALSIRSEIALVHARLLSWKRWVPNALATGNIAWAILRTENSISNLRQAREKSSS